MKPPNHASSGPKGTAHTRVTVPRADRRAPKSAHTARWLKRRRQKQPLKTTREPQTVGGVPPLRLFPCARAGSPGARNAPARRRTFGAKRPDGQRPPPARRREKQRAQKRAPRCLEELGSDVSVSGAGTGSSDVSVSEAMDFHLLVLRFAGRRKQGTCSCFLPGVSVPFSFPGENQTAKPEEK